MATAVADRAIRETPPGPGPADGTETLLASLAVVAVALIGWQVWLPMLGAGPRLDETLTTWVVSDGLDDAVSRSWRYQGQSPVYFALLWVWAQAMGSSILVLRIPTVLAVLAAGWHLRRLCVDLGLGRHRDLALAVFFGFSTVHVNAVAARPYGLLLLTVILASRAGCRWASTGDRADALRWAVLCAATVYFQPLAVYALIPQGWWLVRRHQAGDRPIELMGPVIAAGALVLPLVPQVLSLARRQTDLAFAEVPSVGSLISSLVPGFVMLGLATGAVLAWPWARRTDLLPVTPFVLGVALVPQIGLFVQSYLTGNGVFVAKYLMPATIGMALATALVTSHFARRAAVAVAAVVMILPPVVGLDPLGSHGWQDAVSFVETEYPDAVVLAQTGFIEASDVSFLDDPEASSYLAAPLTNEGLQRQVHMLPLGSEPEHGRHVDELVDRVAGAEEVAVVRAVAGLEPDLSAERALRRQGYTQVARIEPHWLLVTVWRR